MRTNIAMDKSKATMNRLTQQLAKKRRVKALATSIFKGLMLDFFILLFSIILVIKIIIEPRLWRGYISMFYVLFW